MTATALHPRLHEIADEFGAVPGTERLQLLLEFSQELPPLPARYATRTTSVRSASNGADSFCRCPMAGS